MDGRVLKTGFWLKGIMFWEKLFIPPVLAAVILVLVLLVLELGRSSRKRRFTVKENRGGSAALLSKKMQGWPLFGHMLERLAVRIGMFNSRSHEKNLEYAALGIIAAFPLAFLVILLFLPAGKMTWYVTAGYVLIGLIFMVLLYFAFALTAEQHFTDKLPQVYKLLNSRYTVAGNILKAIDLCMDDFPGPVKKVMLRIHNVLKKNDRLEIDRTFAAIEKAYGNEYLILLLNLIKQAYFKGGDEVIKRQFEETTEDIFTELENRRDLAFTARMYMCLAVFLPFGLKLLERFNHSALGEKAAGFYASSAGMELKALFLVFFLAYMGLLIFMERTV